ncbi:hypothetical protein PF327_08955 [Sulfurovum sp. XTW-4]|uniref:Transmembrane protein n=1 Tax=Sulfurovum xiamenensis TaxID=3019066 RepID=A0ABT7QTE1_9BACT|nr:hypothetical protein [Sulfurovum xiamenensis]MDM5264321.1 hypothetical protein [Sulfurovum xiamenensis]
MIESRNKKRDYDKDPITIKDYGAYFQLSLLMLIFLVVVVLWVMDIQNGELEKINYGSFEFFRKVIVAVLMLWFVYFLYKLPKYFQKKPSHFKFYNQKFQYIEYFYDKEGIKTEFDLSTDSIERISFCVIAELQDRYARLHYLSSWQLYRKSSIGVHIGKATIFIRYFLTYLIFVLPYKVFRLYRSGEPFSLLRKNLFIQFKNRNYLLINIYSQKELDELLEYFQIHNIPVNEKTYFIPHLQNQGWFVDKEEVWTNEFNTQKSI